MEGLFSSNLSSRYELWFFNLAQGDVREGGQLTGGNLARTLRDAVELWRLSRDADLVHIHSALGPQLTLLRAGCLAAAAKLGRSAVAVHGHGGRIEQWVSNSRTKWVARLGLAFADRVICVSVGSYSALVAALGQERVVLIENGVDVDAFGPASEGGAIPRLLFVGGLTPRKGAIDLMVASAMLTDRGVKHELLLVGGTPDEGRQEEIRVRKAAPPHAQFLGLLPHSAMPDLYRAVDVFCLPSWWEAMPLSVLEAMASGLPVVASRVGDIPRLVEDGVSGRLVAARAPEQLADALESVLQDSSLRRRMGQAGRRLVQERFTVDESTARVDAVYSELLGMKQVPRDFEE